MAIALQGETPESLALRVPGLQPAVARRLLSRALGRDLPPLEDVPGLSRAVKQRLGAAASLGRLELVDRRRSDVDPFVKYLFRAPDGRVFETVRIPLERPRFSVCVSTQVGCALGCAFCETGRLGLTRNLEAWEIVEQVRHVRRDSPERPVTGVVFQGQGEPLQNYDSVMRAASVLRHPCGLGIRGDRITISTVGLLPQILRYTDEGHPYRLILSLTSAFSERRAALVPLGARYAVEDLAAAARRHAARRGGPVHLAFVLLAGINTGPDEARELGRLFAGQAVRLSLIDVNDPTGRFRPPDAGERGRFLSALAEQGIGFVRRYSGGPDIHAACGMLAAKARGGTAL
ncbi:MAG: radical SAM protein [Vicinamibacteria bacterium]